MEVPSHRACAFCRSQKVRCIVEEGAEEGSCQRCVKAGRACVFTPLQKRKQRKRTDTRVAELEREMTAMRSLLKDKGRQQQAAAGRSGQGEESGGGRAPGIKAPGLWYKELSEHAPPREEAFGERTATAGEGGKARDTQRDIRPQPAPPSVWPKRSVDRPAGETRDVVDRGLLSMATARQLFESYRRDLFPHYPMVHIPDAATADEMRATKPTLFLAILAAAASQGSPEVSAMLDKEVLQTYATKSLVHSEKSLELVQSLLLSSVWYHPPNKFGQLKYYEYIHMAATMALDIGIGTRRSNQRSRFGKHRTASNGPDVKSMHPLEDAMNPDLSMTPRSRDSSPDTGSVESRRTFLACFIICAAVSMSLRRPNMLRASSYIRESVDYIERARDAVPSDRVVVAWVKLIIIQDEIGTAFAYDDPGGIASITDLRTQLMLKDFERRQTDWWTGTPAADMTGSLVITYYTTRLYLHEIALHVDHSPEDFRAPYQMGVIEPLSADVEIPSRVLAVAVAESITCAHRLLDAFLDMSPVSLRALPVFSFVRVSFAAFMLAKLCLSAAHPESRIGRVLDRGSLKAEPYLERAIHHVRAVVGDVRSRVPAIFLALLFKLRAWCLHPEMIEWSVEEEGREQQRENQLVSRTQVFQKAPATEPQLTAAAAGGSTAGQSDGLASSQQGSAQQQSVQSADDTQTTGPGMNPGYNGMGTGLTPQSILSDATDVYGQPLPSTTHAFGVISGDKFTQPSFHDEDDVAAEINSMTTPQMNDLIEHMELDSNFLDYFGDMDAFVAGGPAVSDGGWTAPTAGMSAGEAGYDGVFGYQFQGGHG